MKKTFKTVALLICAALCLSVMGCMNDSGPISGIKGEITINYFLGGFGDDYIKAVVKDYTENINPDARINLTPSGSNAGALDKIRAGTGDDMYIANTNFFGLQQYLLNIDDVIESEVYGEEGVYVGDKINSDILDYFNEKGGHYQFPQNNLTGYRWVMNKSVLDSALGVDAYTVPRTTDELFEFGDTLQLNEVYLTATAIGNGAKVYEDYLEYAFRVWFMQMTGNEAYDKFYDGKYKDGTGEWYRDEISPAALFDANASAIEAAYAVAQKLCTPSSISGKDEQYLHKGSTGMQYKDVDVVFYGGKISGTTQPRMAFMVSGNWLEREVAQFASNGVISMNQEILPIKTPVISAITERTSFKGEETLRKVIDYVDGVLGATLPVGVSDTDIEIITEARNAAAKGMEEVILITKGTRYPDLCKDFLRYLVSDRAQIIAAKKCSGISILPYGYEPVEADMGFSLSDYVKEFNRLSKDVVIVDLTHGNQGFTQKSGLNWYADTRIIGSNRLARIFFTNAAAPSPSTIVASSKSKFDQIWRSAVNEYNAQYGE